MAKWQVSECLCWPDGSLAVCARGCSLETGVRQLAIGEARRREFNVERRYLPVGLASRLASASCWLIRSPGWRFRALSGGGGGGAAAAAKVAAKAALADQRE